MVKTERTYIAKGSALRLLARASAGRLVFITDDDRVPNPAAVLRALPAGDRKSVV